MEKKKLLLETEVNYMVKLQILKEVKNLRTV